ncbi:transcription factor iws1 [Moniliophthora roreri MCA 2997]|uniref:Transcription factor iws1 n=2 Tax=Moniliophthora roreri TaxID=221103 RepID=V2X478_MONRO|nr:transcription factor iws1 [Moniliophthora roreri MCA 2997]KAI3615142.1 transcription factor iws1 [Moniliophthora roreri]
MPEDKQLARDIFGGSDSELSSEDEGANVSRQKQRTRSPSLDDGVDDGEGEYREPGKAIKKKKKKVRVRDEGEGGERRKRKRTSTSARKEPEYTEADLSEMPPEKANKIRINQQIEAALKSKRSSRPKKRKNDSQILDSFADDEVARLRENMNMAADEDIRANQEKQPATAKLKLLPEAMDTLRKSALAQSIIDNNLLDAVKRWLEPLPDTSLPALNIQREFFGALRKMEFIDSSVLKESGLGPLVLFYTKCKRVQPDVRRIADELVSTWSRPIIKRSASYRDRVVPVASASLDAETQGQRDRLQAILARAKAADANRVKRNTVSIPQPSLGTYTVAPSAMRGVASSQGGQFVREDVERRRKNAERLRMLTRKVQGNKGG